MRREASLKVGYLVCQQVPSHDVGGLLSEIAEEAKVAESVGFDGVFVSEHHQRGDDYIPSPLLLASFLSQQTRRLHIGIAVAILPLYHPVRLAEDAALIDHMCGGRLILGVGAGYMQPDLEGFGVDRKHLGSLMEEGIEIILRSWTEEGWGFRGRHHVLANMHVTPKPLQRPRPTLWVAAASDQGVRRAARLGDGWVIGARYRRDTIEQWATVYRAVCSVRRKSPYVAVIRDAWVGSSHRAVEEEFGRHALASAMERVRGGHLRAEYARGGLGSNESSYDVWRQDRWMVGEAEEIVQQIALWQETVGVNYFIFRFRHPTGPPHGQVLDQVEKFAQFVIRPLRQVTSQRG